MRGGVGVLSVFEGLRKQWCRMLALKQAKQALKSSSNFSLVLFGKGRKHIEKNFNRHMQKL